MAQTFGDSVYVGLVVAHAISGIALVGAGGHLLVTGVQRWRAPDHLRSMRLHALTALGALLVTIALGLLAYPHYRYFVRGLVLDARAPWASNLFDIKENLAAFALPLVVALAGVELDGDPAPPSRRLSAVLAICTGLLLVICVVAGLVVTATRGAL